MPFILVLTVCMVEGKLINWMGVKMKKVVLGIMVCVALAATWAVGQQVLSKNAVGYVKVDMEGGGTKPNLYLVAHPFESLTDANGLHLVSNVFAAVPNNTIVSVWDPIGQGYVQYGRDGRGTWLGAAATAKISRSQGAFVRIPSNATQREVFLMGEVPDKTTAPSQYMSRAEGLTMIGFPYPVATRLTNTVMAQALPNNTIISVWDSAAQTYVQYGKDGRGNWLGAAATAELQPGQGMVIRNTNAPNSWWETKPYSWP